MTSSSYSPVTLLRYLPNFVSNSLNSFTNYSSDTSSSSSLSSSAFDNRQGINYNFISFSGIRSIWKRQNLRAHAMNTAEGNFASTKGIITVNEEPDHLLVLVHGIMGSPSDWTYVEAALKRQLGRNFLIYASSSNSFTKTFTGIDESGKRLADEVMQIVEKTKSLKKISFLAHSLGGLFARYALALLYTANQNNKGVIAGLEPINFITLATPHLGVRGNKQLPFLLGVSFLEKLAPPIAPFLVGRTGSQLFLTDENPEKPPLLLQMASDCDDGLFISALGAFRWRVLYANVSYDHMVGWRTSSIRRESELVEPPQRSLDGYEHIVDVKYCPPVVSSKDPHFPPEAAKAKESVQNEASTGDTLEYHQLMEEEMIHGLQQLGWKKIDISFHSAPWPFFAHYNIHVRSEWFHNAGAGVVAHVADHIKQHESSTLVAASTS